MEIDQLMYQECFNLLTTVQYSHRAWFLDGRASILVQTYVHIPLRYSLIENMLLCKQDIKLCKSQFLVQNFVKYHIIV